MKAVAPGLADYTDNVLFGDNWEQPSLAKRDRSLLTLSALIAGGKTPQMPGHLGRALDNGLKPAEISGLITHLAFYTGWPNAVSATSVVREVFGKRGIDATAIAGPAAPAPSASDAQEMIRSGALDDAAAAFAPDLARYTREVIFADLWQRTDLSPRDRSLATIAALITSGDARLMAQPVNRALDSGLSPAELAAAITHLAFYAGWLRATNAAEIARAIVAKRETGAQA